MVDDQVPKQGAVFFSCLRNPPWLRPRTAGRNSQERQHYFDGYKHDDMSFEMAARADDFVAAEK